VDAPDGDILRAAWGARTGEAGYEPAADFKDDGRTNILDAFLLNESWGESLDALPASLSASRAAAGPAATAASAIDSGAADVARLADLQTVHDEAGRTQWDVGSPSGSPPDLAAGPVPPASFTYGLDRQPRPSSTVDGTAQTQGLGVSTTAPSATRTASTSPGSGALTAAVPLGPPMRWGVRRQELRLVSVLAALEPLSLPELDPLAAG
jgi:hypothetical protein